MTVYGSVSRGEAHEASDVDLMAFMEVTDAADSAQSNTRVSPERKTRPHEKLTPTRVFHTGIQFDYQKPIHDRLISAGIPAADIDVYPISPEIVDQGIKDLLSAARAYANHETEKVVVSRNVRGLFHKAIGPSRLQPYIDQVLEELPRDPYGELGWAMIRNQVIGFEKGRDRTFEEHTRAMPETLEEARLEFGSAEITAQ